MSHTATRPTTISPATPVSASGVVFEVAVVEVRLLREPQHLAGLREVAGEGLLAGDAQKGGPALHGPADGAHVVEAGVVGAGNPDGINLLRGDELLLSTRKPCTAQDPSRSPCSPVPRGGGAGRAVDPAHSHIADAERGLQVEVRDKAAAEESDS